jgi:hypothetical protein
LAGCDTGSGGGGLSTSGKLTITGISSYNGKYAYAMTASGTSVICAQATSASAASAKPVLISNGQVVLSVYESNGFNLASYSGSETISLGIMIYATTDMQNPVASGTASVTFASGIGTVDNPFE